MTDQPNRPANRMDFTAIEDMEALGRTMFLDGVIEGLPLAKNVKLIIEQAVMFGRDEAGRSDRFYATVRDTNINDLIANAVRSTVDGMFGGKGMESVAHNITLVGTAYGFQSEKHKMKYAAVEAALAKLVAEHAAGPVADETADAFFGEVIKVESAEVAIEYVSKVLTELKIPVSTKLPNFKLFVDRYSRVLLDQPMVA